MWQWRRRRLCWILAVAAVAAALVGVQPARADCAGNLCANNATCIDTGGVGGGYTCQCTRAWIGELCDVSAGCDAAPFNAVTAPPIPGAPYTIPSYGALYIVVTRNHTLAAQAYSSLPAFRVSASTRVNETGAQSFDYRFPFTALTANYAAYDDTAFVQNYTQGVLPASAVEFHYDGGAWQTVQTINLTHNVLTAMTANAHWVVFLSYNPPVDPVYSFYRRSGSTPASFYQEKPTITITASTLIKLSPGDCVGDQFLGMAYGGINPAIADITRFNTTSQLWEFHQRLALSGFTPRAATMGCGTFAVGGFITTAGAILTYKYNGSLWDGPTRLPIPNPVSGERCGDSVSIEGDTLVVGCPLTPAIPNSDTGRVIEYSRLSNGTWVVNRILTDHCSPTFRNGTNTMFGSSVGIYDGQITVGVPGYSNSSGVLLQFGKECPESTCLPGNTCMVLPETDDEQQCVCTVDDAPCELPELSSSGTGTGIALSSSTGHSHNGAASRTTSGIGVSTFYCLLIVHLVHSRLLSFHP